MLEALDRIRSQMASTSEFFGTAVLEDLQAQLAGLPDDSTDRRRLRLHRLLGENHLRIGNLEEAMRHYREVERLVQIQRDVLRPARVADLLFGVAVAYLRVGESENCCARHTPESCIFPIQGSGIHTIRGPSEEAVRVLTEVLEEAPPGSCTKVKARWLLTIARMTLGLDPGGADHRWEIPPETFASDEEFPPFADIAAEVGVDTFGLAGGAAGDDFDGDGLLDLLVTSSDPAGQMRFFRNDGTGSFEDRTVEAGLEGLVGGLNLVHADADGDEDLDALVLRGGWWRTDGQHPNSLLQNDGRGRFQDVTFEVGLGDPAYPTQTAGWADYDGDGDLDLFVGNEYDRTMPAPGQLFENDGTGHFTDVAPRAGVENQRYAKAVAWGDVDEDGLPDLFVSNMANLNRLYRNGGDGTFTDIAREAGVLRPINSFPSWFWDFDNDGHLDLFVASFGETKKPANVCDVASSYLGRPHGGERDRLYRGDGTGRFEEVTKAQGLQRFTLPMGSNWGDLDNDGFPDFYLGTGYPHYEALMPNLMFHNLRGRGFADVTTAGRFGNLQKGHAVVFADLDNDGDQDVFEEMGGQYPGDAFRDVLFENPGFGNHWIKIQLRGRRSNAFGLGAHIRLDIDEAGTSRSIHHTVSTGGSFGSNPYRQEIGLGHATRIALLEVTWPASGERQRFRNVTVDQAIEITEGEAAFQVVSLPRIVMGNS